MVPVNGGPIQNFNFWKCFPNILQAPQRHHQSSIFYLFVHVMVCVPFEEAKIATEGCGVNICKVVCLFI